MSDGLKLRGFSRPTDSDTKDVAPVKVESTMPAVGFSVPGSLDGSAPAPVVAQPPGGVAPVGEPARVVAGSVAEPPKAANVEAPVLKGDLIGGTPRKSRRSRSTAASTGAPKPENNILQADIRSKSVMNKTGAGKKVLIRDIRVKVKEGSLVALLGSSGAGKTTLMNCLNGSDQSMVDGTVYFMGQDLYPNFDRLKFYIGSVPQENRIHTQLSVQEELREAAQLRLPSNTSNAEIEKRVERTLKLLNLTQVRNSKNHQLSGGEKKRVNIGIELVANRKLLCLDEPDAGLDPESKKELFTILRKLAHRSRKGILVIIHDVSDIDMFDQIIMLTKVDNEGRLAFSGTPKDATAHFEVTNLKDAYSKIKENPKRFIKN